MYHISTISDILRQGVDSLAQWLEYWISTPRSGFESHQGRVFFFQTMHHFLVRNFHIRKTVMDFDQTFTDIWLKEGGKEFIRFW